MAQVQERRQARREVLRLLAATAQGLELLRATDAAEQRTAMGLGTAAVEPAGSFQAAAALLDLIVAQTTAFGTAWLALANAAAGRTNLGLGTLAVLNNGDDLDSNACITVQSEGSDKGTRRRVNFIPGAGITLSIIDDEENGAVNVEIALA